MSANKDLKCNKDGVQNGTRHLKFFNLRAKRGGSLFEVGSEREEHGGVPSAQKQGLTKVSLNIGVGQQKLE